MIKGQFWIVFLPAASSVSQVKNFWVDQESCRPQALSAQSPLAIPIILVSSGQKFVLQIKTNFEVSDGLLMLWKRNQDDWRLTTQVFKPKVKKEKKHTRFFSMTLGTYYGSLCYLLFHGNTSRVCHPQKKKKLNLNKRTPEGCHWRWYKTKYKFLWVSNFASEM